MQSVAIDAGELTLAGHLYLPPEASAEAPVPGILFSGPFTGVKDQVTGAYAERGAAGGLRSHDIFDFAINGPA